MHLLLLVPLHRMPPLHRHHLQPPPWAVPQFYLGVVIREYNLFGRADIILCNIENMQLSILKNERSEDLKLWKRWKPVPPAPGPLVAVTTLPVLKYLLFWDVTILVCSLSKSSLPPFCNETSTLLKIKNVVPESRLCGFEYWLFCRLTLTWGRLFNLPIP